MNSALVSGFLAATLLLSPPAAAQAIDVPSFPPTAESEDWWRLDYLADYASVIASGALLATLRGVEPSSTAAMGPSYDPNDWEAVLDPRLGDQIGRVHRPDTVSELSLGIWAGTGLAGIMIMEWIPVLNGLDETDWQLAHDAVLGYVEAIAWTLAVTEITKTAVGRLRPDFQDRARRYHCGTLEQTDGACTGFSGQPISEDEYKRGRKSFVSGHASLSFAMATYWSWVIGGRLVWGKRAKSSTVALGVLMQGALLASAAYVTAARVDDGRHHASDVATGALLGFGLATVAYLRHFRLDGLPRTRAGQAAASVDVGPSAAGLGLGLSGRF